EARLLVAALLRAAARVPKAVHNAAARLAARRGRLAARRRHRRARPRARRRQHGSRAAALAPVRGRGLVSAQAARRGAGAGRGRTDEGGGMTPFVPDVSELRRWRRSAGRIARTRYPAFLFGREVPADEIPVFTYHDIDADELDRDLEFLERNGYRTLSLDEFCERMRAPSRHGRENCVLLTFDDARKSFFDAAYPVLKRRGARAALFVPTYWVGDRHVSPADATPPGFMTWAQIAECAASGLVDVESHAYRHTLVFTSARLAGFATPRALRAYDLFDWPMRRERGGGVCGRRRLGTPIFESAPLLAASHRYIEPALPASTCRSLVEAGGGEGFFERRGALAELKAAYASVAGRVRGELV